MTRSNAAVAAYAAGVVLVPYLTVGLEFRHALVAQAAALLLLAGGALAIGLAQGGGRSILRAPRWLLAGLGLYAGAAAAGALVGLLSGNGLSLLAGQLLSMGLLPLAAVAGLALEPRRTWRTFAVAVPVAVAAMVLVHLAVWLVAARRGEEVRRLILGNSISISGPAVLAVLLALAWVGAARRRLPLAVLVLLAVLAGTVGSGTRGVWAAVALAWPLGLLLGIGRGGRRRWIVATSVAALVVAAGSLWGLDAWVARERPDLVPARAVERSLRVREAGSFPADGKPFRAISWGTGERSRVGIGPFPVPGAGLYRLKVVVGGGESGRAQVVVRWLDAEGARLGQIGLRPAPSDRWRTRGALGHAPSGTAEGLLELRLPPATRGTWHLRRARLERLAPGWAASPLTTGIYLERRVRSLFRLLDERRVEADESVSVRLAESRAVLARVADAPPAQKLLGHGLGATFTLDPGVPSAAVLDPSGRQNYIHDFYLFLLFKLGVVGTVLVLVALAAWIAGTLRCCLRATSDRRRSLLAAAVAIWAGYALLAVSSPEILNFRVAPLLGWLLAATAGACAAEDEA